MRSAARLAPPRRRKARTVGFADRVADALGCSIVGHAAAASVADAVCVNAQLVNLLDFDDCCDFYLPGHPDCRIVPSALAGKLFGLDAQTIEDGFRILNLESDMNFCLPVQHKIDISANTRLGGVKGNVSRSTLDGISAKRKAHVILGPGAEFGTEDLSRALWDLAEGATE